MSAIERWALFNILFALMKRLTLCTAGGIAALIAACSSSNDGTGSTSGFTNPSTATTSTANSTSSHASSTSAASSSAQSTTGATSSSATTASTSDDAGATSSSTTTTTTSSSDSSSTSSSSSSASDDAGADTGADAGADTGADAGADTGTDAGADTGSGADAGADTGADATVTAACPAGIPGGGTGCAVLTVPLSGASQSAHFVVQLSPNLVDFTGATISVVAIAPGAAAGVLQAYIQHGATLADGGSGGYSGSYLGWSTLSADSSWQTLTWPVKPASDNTSINYLGMSVESGPATGTSTFEQPATAVYIASITVTAADGSTPIYSIDFGASGSVSQAMYANNALWLNGNDGPLAGSTLGWLAAP